MKTVQFMTARQKAKVLKDWQNFLTHGLRQEDFTQRLYEHLHLHCGFIGHYNQSGFYAEYFQTGQDSRRFFKCFLDQTSEFSRSADYADINNAMREAFEKHRASLNRQADRDIGRRLKLLEACLTRAQGDPVFARQFLDQISF